MSADVSYIHIRAPILSIPHWQDATNTDLFVYVSSWYDSMMFLLVLNEASGCQLARVGSRNTERQDGSEHG